MLGMKSREVKEWEAAAQENVQRQNAAAAELQRAIDELEEVRERWKALESERQDLLKRMPAPGTDFEPTEERERLKALAEVEGTFDRTTPLRCGIPQTVIGAVDKVMMARSRYRQQVEFLESEKKDPPKPSHPDAQRFTLDDNVDGSRLRIREMRLYGPGGLTPPDGYYGPLDPQTNPLLRGERR